MVLVFFFPTPLICKTNPFMAHFPTFNGYWETSQASFKSQETSFLKIWNMCPKFSIIFNYKSKYMK